jgi:cation diffusion facilitator CzcD-associated flavoprotein CzcO
MRPTKHPTTGPSTRAQPSIAIIGAGFGGLAAAAELRRAGFENFTIFEKGATVGGVWRENTYPGAACDVPSSIYSFSFALNGTWSQLFGGQTEIHDYLQRVSDDLGLTAHIRFQTEVVAASFDEQASLWTIELASGDEHTFSVVVMATGQLSRPKLPEFPGQGSFTGPSFHSAQWDHTVDLTGKRVAVVGSGASAIQIVPAIADQVADLTVIQRSPNWVIWKSKRRHGRLQAGLLARFKLARRIQHNAMFLAYDLRWPLVSRTTNPIRVLSQWVMKQIIARNISDPNERAAAIPRYRMLCNRLLLSNDWYPTLGRPDVHLVGSPVASVSRRGLRTADGHDISVDAIIWCLGFRASEFLAPIRITGRDGVELREKWAEGAEAYLGMSVPGFPNLFVMFGPNTNSITNTIVFMLERQASYLRQAVQYLAREGGWVDVRESVHADFQTYLQRRLARTVFTDNCPGWYTNAAGKVTAMWPNSHISYARHTRRFRPERYKHAPPIPASASGEVCVELPPTTQPRPVEPGLGTAPNTKQSATSLSDPSGITIGPGRTQR